VTARIDERYVGRVRPGLATITTTDGRSFPATVRGIDTLGAATRTPVTYEVTLDLSNPDGALAAGMSATVALSMTSDADALQVPTAALQATPSGPQLVTANRAGQPIPTAVTTGISNGAMIEVVGFGLGIDQSIVADAGACPALRGDRQ